MPKRTAIVREGHVLNIAVLSDTPGAWSPGDGLDTVDLPDGLPVGPGWTFDGDTFAPPEPTPPAPPPPPSALEVEVAALTVATRIAVVDRVRAGDLEEEDLARLSAVFPPLDLNGASVTAREVYVHDGRLVEVVQSHVTQPDWTPEGAPALWKVHRQRTEPGAPLPVWEPGLDVVAGELLTHDGVTYRVVQTHRTQSGWEPPNVPAIWTAA